MGDKGHKGIRIVIERTAKSLADNIQFTYARTTDFNVMRDKKYPFITLDPLQSSPQYATDGTHNYMKSWLCTMAFYQLDSAGSDQDDYALILDEMDSYVDKFLNKLNFFTFKSDHLLLQGISQQPFVKATADILTGYILTFTLQAEDDFDYCAEDLDCVIADECGDN